MTEHRTLAPGVDLYLGKSEDVLPLLKEQGGVVLTDPPYGINYVGAGQHHRIAGDDRPRTELVKPMADLLQPNSVFYLFTREDVAEIWKQAMRDAELKLKTTIIWDKVIPSGLGDTGGDVRSQTEMLLVGHKGRPLLIHPRLDQGGHGRFHPWTDHGRFHPNNPQRVIRRDTSLWSVQVPRGKKASGHPTSKPPELMERALLNSTASGDLVLDPYMGGAPVGVAAVRLGRRYVGIEVDAGYFQLAVQNVQRALDERDAIRRALGL